MACYSIDMNDFTLEQIQEIVHKLERSQLSGANLGSAKLRQVDLSEAKMDQIGRASCRERV